MKAVIKKQYPNYTIHDYDGVGHEIKLPNSTMMPVTTMTEDEKEECDEAYHKIVLSRLLVMNNNKDYVRTFLNNLYINNKAEYPNTAASTLLQITSIKPENNNQKTEAVVNVHAVNEHKNNDVKEALSEENHSEVQHEELSEEPIDGNKESVPTMEDIIAAAAASKNEGINNINPEELDFMEEEPKSVEVVCAMVEHDVELFNYDLDISEEESTAYSSTLR